ncbi:unnamed protein product [Brassicogethes aeneus]|uniref:ATP-dependent DNA helicase n=1 Tax=Brassicogethes aeneus TaxID=1431903 RepID=A0A9P0FME0_BRAAE|nr:unnamed protein product [Brassicogethes aeneus]
MSETSPVDLMFVDENPFKTVARNKRRRGSGGEAMAGDDDNLGPLDSESFERLLRAFSAHKSNINKTILSLKDSNNKKTLLLLLTSVEGLERIFSTMATEYTKLSTEHKVMEIIDDKLSKLSLASKPSYAEATGLHSASAKIKTPAGKRITPVKSTAVTIMPKQGNVQIKSADETKVALAKILSPQALGLKFDGVVRTGKLGVRIESNTSDLSKIPAAVLEEAGPDCITVQMQNNDGIVNWDEIRQFLDCRYISAMEACWRLFEFKLGIHAVMALPVHIPDDHPINFDEFDNVDDIREALDKPTKLTAYFILNSNYVEARQYRYHEIPEHFTWETRTHIWRPRVQVAKMFGCMVEVSPLDLEKWCLRLLLSHVSGATSFESLRTVDNIVYENFEAACRARNFLHNIDEYDRCLQQALWFRTPKGFRKLFALICCVAAAYVVGQIPQLWERHRADLIEDFVEQYQGNDMFAETRALMEIADVLKRNGNFTLAQFGLPDVNQDLVDFYELPLVNHKEDLFADFAGDEQSLNEEQRDIFHLVMSAIEDNNNVDVPDDFVNIFYVDAPGGTGKTFLFNTLLKTLRMRRFDTVAVAWTVIAAFFLLAGKTAHKAFRLPLNITENAGRCGYPMESERSNYIKNAKLIVWDEAPMSSKYAITLVNNYLRDLMQKPRRPMGGKIVIFGGDFRQILPVVPHGHRTQIIATSLKASPLWPLMRKCQLHENIRAGPDQREFSEWLLRLGDGKLPHVKINNANDETIPKDLIEIPKQCLINTFEQLCKTVFGERFQHASTTGDRTILCPTNLSVNEINNYVLNNLPGEEKVYVSIEKYDNVEGDELYVNQDYLQSISIASLPPHELKLKVGAVCMLLRNLDVDMGQCNGARCKIIEMKDHVLTGSFKNVSICVENTTKQGNFKFRTGRCFTRNIGYETIVENLEPVTIEQFVEDDLNNRAQEGEPETVLDFDDIDFDDDFFNQLVISEEEDDDDNGAAAAAATTAAAAAATTAAGKATDATAYVDEDEQLRRILMPTFTSQQLRQRVSTGDQAGTTGLRMPKPTKRPRVTYSESDDSD